jgi:hypothetical protein
MLRSPVAQIAPSGDGAALGPSPSSPAAHMNSGPVSRTPDSVATTSN